MEEMLKQILDGQQEIRQEINLLHKEIGKVNNRLDSVEQGYKDIKQQINDLRDSNFIAIETLGKEIGAMRDTQAVAMDKWNKSMDIMERVEAMLDERETERVAIDATLVGHEERITILEQRVG